LKRILIALIPFVLLTFSALSRNTFAAPPPQQLEARFSNVVPVIDGYLGGAEWNDTAMYNVSLTGNTDIGAWLYVKHNATHIHLGLVVWSIGTHLLDEFLIVFDEGDDGNSGSGSRDHTLTPLQEDGKAVMNDHTLYDCYYNLSWYATLDEIDFDADCAHENDHSTSVSEIEYWEGLGWVDDHWECEFAIPFVGNDTGTSDVSDLSCNVTDIVGIKIQYYYPSESYFYPAGNKMQVDTFADLSFPVPLVESCDSLGVTKDSFSLHEDVYANGSGFLPNATYDFHIVDDVDTWTDGMAIPTGISGTASLITSDSDGVLLPVIVWSDPPTIGAYDMIVDVNKNGLYDEGIDTLDSGDVQVTAGFVIPEFPVLSVLFLLQLAVCAVMVFAKRHQPSFFSFVLA